MLERKRFTGTLGRHEQTFPVDFEVWAGEDFRLQLAIDPVPTATYFAVQPEKIRIGSPVESLVLQGNGADGAVFYSDSIELIGTNSNGVEHRIRLSARGARVSMPCEPVVRPQMCLWLRAFRSSRMPLVSMSLGEVLVRGASKPESDEDVSGSIIVEGPTDAIHDEWVERTDEFLTFMHRGLAFSQGTRLQSPALDVLFGNRMERRFYDGSASGASFAPIHYLDQTDFIKALVERYDQQTSFPDKLWTVIGWLHANSPHSEAKFLMAMTSVETAVQHLLPETSLSIIPKPLFRPICDALLGALRPHELEETPAAILQNKIRQLNGPSLTHKIQALRDHYGLRADIFTDAKIKEIVTTRNRIVHEGGSETRREIWPLYLFTREFLTHIAFLEIGYSGRFQTLIESLEDVDD